jgi:hypothetical protein
MSTIIADNLTGKTSAGDITVTSEGGAATQSLQQGLAKAWVRFDGSSSPLSVADSFNKSSVTDNGTGDYSPQMTNSMSSENYSPLYTSSQYHELMANNGGTTGTLTGSYKISIRNSANSAADTGRVASSVFGDLA